MSKILVVEDERLTRQMVSDMVEASGHVAIQASNGKVALLILQDNPAISMVITDYKMPELDGPGLIAAIRENASFANLPIVLMSAVASIEEMKSMIEHGASHFIRKPVTKEVLGDYLKRYTSA